MNSVMFRNGKYFAFLFLIAVFFQNCGKPYHVASTSQSSNGGLAVGVDTTAPNVQVIAPLSGASVKSTLAVAGSCEDGIAVELSVGTGTATKVNCVSGMFNYTMNLVVADGAQVLNVSQQDLAGNKTFLHVNFVKDTVAPSPRVNVPAMNATLASSSVTVSGSCDTGYSVTIAGTALAAPVSANCANGMFSAGATVVGPNGVKTITTTQTDLAGNTATTSVNVNVNIPAGAPVIQIASPAANSATRTGITLTGSCVTGLTINVAGTGISAAKTATCSGSAFSTAITFSSGDGLKNITVSQTNSNNQTGQDARSFNFDTTAPVVQIMTPNAGTQALTGLNIGGSCETGLSVSVSGAGVSAPSTATCTNSQFQAAITFSAGLGVKAVTVAQTDSAGNVGSNSRNFERIDPPPVNGTILYANNCAGCHQPLANSTKKNRTFAQIKGAIASIPQMSGMVLTDPEIQAIATALISTPGPVPVNTAALYTKGAYGTVEMRRLTRYELINSLNGALGVNPTNFMNAVPGDLAVTIYFDNEAGSQGISSSHIDGYRSFAASYSVNVASNATRINTLGGCTPASAGDRACFTKFAQKIGRRILRRVISSTEANHFADVLLPYAVADNKFGTAVGLLLQAWLQHPEFLYRIESGPTSAGLVELNDFQIASRISFLITGSSTDDTLLDAAQNGQLKTESVRIAQAQRLLADPKAKAHLTRFHSEWLGYANISLDPTLGPDMRNETAKLIERVVFELNDDWMKLLTWNETYVTPALASTYGFPSISSANWVTYSGQRGGGILSHATFAALGSKFGDTSPTLRGYEVFKRLMCGKLGQIPAGVDTDNPPGLPGQCKPQAYTMRTNAACMGCHTITDNIGFGLENIGTMGNWRLVETGLPSCSIAGDGSVQSKPFNGPRELGAVLASDPMVSGCATRQLFRFMTGRLEGTNDEPTLAALSGQYQQSKTFSSLILSLVKSQAIIYKGAL